MIKVQGGSALEIQAHRGDQSGEREGLENGLIWRGSGGENVRVRQRFKKKNLRLYGPLRR